MASPATLRDRKRERTRADLQTAALRQFAERGYDATTINDMVEAADVSQRTFFRYFASKEDVAAWDPYDPVVAELIRARPATEPPLASLRAVVAQMAGALSDDRKRSCCNAAAWCSPRRRCRRVWRDQTAFADTFAGAVAARSGQDRAGFTLRVVAFAATAAMTAAIDEWQRDGGRQPLFAQLDRALAVLHVAVGGDA